jgi:prohibitin 1
MMTSQNEPQYLSSSLMTCPWQKEFTGAVEAKQVAQKEAEIARFVVEKAEQ